MPIQQENLYELWESLTFQNDYIFKRVLYRRKRICKKMLERILAIKIRDIVYIDEEKTMRHRIFGKGIRLDVYAQDENSTVYNIEMQVRSLEDAELAHRSRYYQSMIDIDLLASGADYVDLGNVIVIFICPFPIFDGMRHLYTFRNACKEAEELELGDGTRKVFLSTKGKLDDVDPKVKAFLDYIDGNISDDDLVQEIENEVEDIKRIETERNAFMTYEMKLREERKLGQKEGREERTAEIILSLLKNHIDIDIIQKSSEWTRDAILQLAKKNGILVPNAN